MRLVPTSAPGYFVVQQSLFLLVNLQRGRFLGKELLPILSELRDWPLINGQDGLSNNNGGLAMELLETRVDTEGDGDSSDFGAGEARTERLGE